MATSNFSALTLGWMAIATGVTGILALVSIILLFTVGKPFGTINDICIGAAAIMSGVLAWMLYPQYHQQSPLLSQVALVVAVVGALVVAVGSVLVIFGITGWYLAGLVMAVGNALIGLWLLGLNFSAQQGNFWSSGLAIFGIVIGVIMILGFAASPGIFSRLDSWESAPWYINYVGFAGSLGWLVLYPLWCLWLGRAVLIS